MWSSSRTEKQINVEKFIALYDEYEALERTGVPFGEAVARRLDDLAAEWDDATLRLRDAG